MNRRILLLLWLVGACRPDNPDDHRDPGYAERLIREHQLIPQPDTVASSFTFSLPPQLAEFGLETPAVVAVSPDRCTVAIADLEDRAIHLFRPAGEYLRSFRYGGKRPTGINSLAWIDFVSDSQIALTEMGSGRVVLRDLHGRPGEWWEAAVPSGAVPLVQVGAGPHGTLLEGWLLAQYAVSSVDWPDSLPLVWLRRRDHTEFTSLGTIRPGKGEYLTGGYNYGWARAFADTVWFAFASEGTVLGFVVDSAGTRKPSPDIEVPLPHYFRAAVPFEVQQGNTGTYQIDRHLTGFAVGPAGEFVLAQTTSYPTDGVSLYRPWSALVVVNSAGQRRWETSVQGEAGKVAATADFLYVQVRNPETGRAVITAYRHPWAPGDRPSKRCTTS